MDVIKNANKYIPIYMAPIINESVDPDIFSRKRNY